MDSLFGFMVGFLAAMGLENMLDNLLHPNPIFTCTKTIGPKLRFFFILKSVYSTFQALKAGKPYQQEDLNELLTGRRLLARIFRPLFGMIGLSMIGFFILSWAVADGIYKIKGYDDLAVEMPHIFE